MTRLIAAILVILTAFAAAGAQGTSDDPKLFDAKKDAAGEWVWTLPASGDINIVALLELYSECRDVLIIVDQRKLGTTAGFRTPGANELKGEEIDLFVANCLEESRMAIVDAGANQRKVVPSVEAITYAGVVTVDELETAPTWQWVTLTYHPANADENALRGALQNMASRQGGSINPVQGGGLLICDRADRVKQIHKAAAEVDDSMAQIIEAYVLPEGVSQADAIRVLKDLLSQDQKHRFNPPSFTAGTSEDTLLVRGTSDLQAEAAAALAKLK